MARHRAPRKLSWRVVALLAATGAAVVAAAVSLIDDREPAVEAAETDEPADELVVTICPVVKVVTASSFEPVLADLAPRLATGRDCVRLDLVAADGQTADQAVADLDADVWIPDDGAWANVARVAELDSEATGSGTVVATSPIYMVTDQATADRLNQAGGGWLDLADFLTTDSGVRLVVRDPAGWGEGLVAVGAVGESVWLDAGMDASAEALMTAFPSTRTVMKHALPVEQGDVGLVAEYALTGALAAEDENATAIRTAALLAGSDYSTLLRYTWLPTASGTSDPESGRAMARLLDVLTGDESAAALASAGLRGPDAEPLDQAVAELPSLEAAPFDVFGAHKVDHVFASWYAEERTSDILLAIDVSGSTAAPPDGSDTALIVLIREGILSLAELLPDDSRLSLWQFGAQLDPPRDYVELLGRAELDAAHRDVFQAVADAMTATDTGTGLYDTTLAAYLDARDNYREGIASHAIVFTDGRNEDRPGSITIEDLASELSAATDPARPVQLTIIAFGENTDTELLQSALETTGTYIAHVDNAQEIHAVFIHLAAGGRH